ncbi:MAG: nuclear transport factor 2 family protein [Ruminococcus sp.]|jgi:hypothetical protein
MDDREIAEACYCRMYQGMVEKDEPILREVLAPEFVLIHMTGMRQPLEAFIQAVQNGTLNYSSALHQKIIVHLDGEHGKLTGQSLVHAAVFGGGWHTWRLQLVCSLAKQDGKWQITKAIASTY